MTRTADPARREALLDRILDYACEHGLSDLSLRPLAKAVGSSPRVLLYYFGSKEQLLVEILDRARARQHGQLAALQSTTGLGARETCSLIWSMLSDRRYEPLYRLFFETSAIAMQDPQRFPGFLERAMGEWLDFIARPGIAAGAPRERAYAFATMIVAGYRGFLMDLCATGERERIDRGVELWLDMIERLTTATPTPTRNEEYDATA